MKLKMIGFLLPLFYPCLLFAKGPTETVFLEELTWTEVRDAISSGTTRIILPTGGTEQNGPHMVLGKHNFIIMYAAEQIARKLGRTLVAPVLAYVPEGDIDPPTGHMEFPGTISIPNEYYMRVLEYAARSFKAHGFTDIILIGDSGGNQHGMRMVADTLNQEWAETDVRVHFVLEYYVSGYGREGQFVKWLLNQGEVEASIGRHAGIHDTSQLLAIHPELIRQDKLMPGASAPIPWESEEYKRTGVSGDPTKASATYGRKGLQLKIEAALDQIKHLIVESRK